MYDAALVWPCFMRVVGSSMVIPELTRRQRGHKVYEMVGGLLAGWTDELKKKEQTAKGKFEALNDGESIPQLFHSTVRGTQRWSSGVSMTKSREISLNGQDSV